MEVGQKIRFNITLMKSGENPDTGERLIYGQLSGHFEDLEGQIVSSEAMLEAIPLFLAPRGPSANDIGGPLRWHHNDKFEGRTHELPVGVVKAMWVDEHGFTHFQAVLSKATKEANDLWNLLCEGVVKFGASVGGVILDMRNAWSEDHFRLVPTITKIRIDEISITDNPAFRTKDVLPNGTWGSYVVPLTGLPVLAKSAGLAKAVVWQEEKHPRGEGGKFAPKGTATPTKSEEVKHDAPAKSDKSEAPKAKGDRGDIRQRVYDLVKKFERATAALEKHHYHQKRSTLEESLAKLEDLKSKFHPEKNQPQNVRPKGVPVVESSVSDVFRQVNYEIALKTLKAKLRLEQRKSDAVDNNGHPAPPTSELGNTAFSGKSADQFGTDLMSNGVTGGYNVTSGGDYLLDNRPAVAYAFYEQGFHGETKDERADNLRHLEAVKLFLEKAKIPYRVESLQGSVHNDGSWPSEDHMRLTPGPGGKGNVEHTNQQVIVALPRTQEELEEVAHVFKSISPWEVPDIRVVGSTRTIEGFDTAYANMQNADDGGSGRFIVLSQSGTNANFQKWRKAPIQVLSEFKGWLAE